MIARTVFLIITCFATLALHAQEFSSNKLSATGSLNLSHADGSNSAKNIPIKINNSMQGDISLYHSEHRGVYAVRGEFLLDNLSHEKKYFKYRLVIKDKKGAVAQTRGSIHLGQGKGQKIKLSNMVMRQQDAKNISSYDIQIVESSK